jgi:hypothetical protein
MRLQSRKKPVSVGFGRDDDHCISGSESSPDEPSEALQKTCIIRIESRLVAASHLHVLWWERQDDPTSGIGSALILRVGEIVIHTALARHDYYACKGRREAHTCDTKYMAREKLEAILDALFSERLTAPSFLELCIDELRHRSESNESVVQVQRLTSELERQRAKRDRVIETFLEGILSREERDNRLETIDTQIRIVEDMLAKGKPSVSLDDLGSLTDALAPLAEWRYWSREQKRTLLATLVPDIRVADYQIECLGLNPAIFSNENTRSPADFTTTARANAAARRP